MRPALHMFFVVELEYWHMALVTLSVRLSQSDGGVALH